MPGLGAEKEGRLLYLVWGVQGAIAWVLSVGSVLPTLQVYRVGWWWEDCKHTLPLVDRSWLQPPHGHSCCTHTSPPDLLGMPCVAAGGRPVLVWWRV
jgi:hypothetical protein